MFVISGGCYGKEFQVNWRQFVIDVKQRPILSTNQRPIFPLYLFAEADFYAVSIRKSDIVARW